MHLAELKLNFIKQLLLRASSSVPWEPPFYFRFCEFDYSGYLICGIIQYLSFCDWLVSIKHHVLRVQTCHSLCQKSFLLRLNNIPVYVCTTLCTHSFADGHLVAPIFLLL